MTALLLDTTSQTTATSRPGRPRLQLVGTAEEVVTEGGTSSRPPVLAVVNDPRRRTEPRRRVSPAVRRRRAGLGLVAGALVLLALPLNGTGGSSHSAGPVPAGNARPVEYTVHSGDTLWSIATRFDPSGDPRPLVSELAQQVGSNTVVPGQQLSVP